MSIRVDPRRLSLLKELAAAEGLRPGQLVQRWVEERLDAERSGEARPPRVAAAPATAAPAAAPVTAAPAMGGRLADLEAAVASLAAQVAEIAARAPSAQEEIRPAETSPVETSPVESLPEPPATSEAAAATEPRARRRGRPPKAAPTTPAEARDRVPLHEEIIAVIGERGPSTAAEIADAIRDRGRYQAPRSDRPLDASTVNSRVSNPVYRSRFVRSGHRIGLAEEG